MQELPVLQCALDADALAAQRERYARIAAARIGSDRRPGELVVEFDEARLDHALLEQTLAIERECCPFYILRLDGARLSVRVAEPHQEPALDAIANMLGAGG
ncbi:MAG TPA: hypothetical protein VFN44_23045 [Solirubrobacteraceae bacterium]|nr:hypothetical protein [Solirubrobacteraceae bacterium]